MSRLCSQRLLLRSSNDSSGVVCLYDFVDAAPSATFCCDCAVPMSEFTLLSDLRCSDSSV